MNVLLTSVGRRAYLVKYFQEAIGPEGKVHVCNSDDKSVAFLYADHSIVSPLINDDNYIPFLFDYCKLNHIDIIIPLFDFDLIVLSKNREKFEDIGVRIIVSDESVICACNDKWKTYLYLCENGFKAPKTFIELEKALEAIRNNELSFPVFVKPRFGCGSISVFEVKDIPELEYCFYKCGELINSSYLKYESEKEELPVVVQEKLEGQEYGADIINDLEGKFHNVIVRKKIAMRSGETDIAEIVSNKCIEHTLERLGKTLKHIGNLDCDIFLVKGEPYILEMNARFGGGYPFSHMSGCNLPKAIIAWAEGQTVPSSLLQSNKGFIGYKELTIVGK